MNVLEAMAFVKGEVDFHDNQAAKFLKEKHQSKYQRHSSISRSFAAVVALLEDLNNRHNGSADNYELSLLPSEFANLPEELKQQLSASSGSDKQDLELLQMIENAGGTLSLDRIIFDWYKQKNEILTRKFFTAKLYRLTSKKRLYNIPGKKGVYTIYPPDTSKNKNPSTVLVEGS